MTNSRIFIPIFLYDAIVVPYGICVHQRISELRCHDGIH